MDCINSMHEFICDFFFTLADVDSAGTLISLFYSIWEDQINMLFHHQPVALLDSLLRSFATLRLSLMASNPPI